MTEYSESVPIQYQQGKASFMGMDILVDERVLIPRPETELLVKVSSDLLQKKANPLVLEMCTGSGIVALGIKKLVPEAFVIAADLGQDALDVAVMNLKKFEDKTEIKLVKSDMFSSFGKEYYGKFDCVVANPPYVSEADYRKLDAWVKAEPKIALYAGPEGMDYLKILVEESIKYLSSGSFLACEVGYDQADKMKNKLTECGFCDIESFKDFNGFNRVVIGRKNG